MGAIWVGTMSLVPKLLFKIGSDLGRHHIILPMGAIWAPTVPHLTRKPYLFFAILDLIFTKPPKTFIYSEQFLSK